MEWLCKTSAPEKLKDQRGKSAILFQDCWNGFRLYFRAGEVCARPSSFQTQVPLYFSKEFVFSVLISLHELCSGYGTAFFT